MYNYMGLYTIIWEEIWVVPEGEKLLVYTVINMYISGPLFFTLKFALSMDT